MSRTRHMLSSHTLREDFKAASVEVIGTTVFLLLSLGAIQSAKLSIAFTQGIQVTEFGPHSLDHNIYIPTGAGISLLCSAWVFYRITGGLFNPTVSLALMLIGQITIVRFIFYVITQNKLEEGVSLDQGVFIEFFCTAILLLAILMLAAEKSRITPMAPIGISMTFFACHLFTVTFIGASINPALLGKEHWIYWVGPLGGTCLSVAFYAWLKHTKYWQINPGHTDIHEEDSPEDPVKAIEDREKRSATRKVGDSERPIHDAGRNKEREGEIV